MANLKILRNRIRSVKSTRQITKAMKMVAAAKLRRSQERTLATRPYSERMQRILHSLAASVSTQDGAPPLLAGRGEAGRKVELVVFTSDRGLCGSFNSTVVRAVRSRIVKLQQEGFQVSLTCVGRKGHDVLKRQYGSLVRKTHFGMGRRLTFQVAEQEVAMDLMRSFNHKEFDVCYMVFNTFRSAMSQELTWRQIIPVPQPEAPPVQAATKKGEQQEQGSFLYEPSEEELLELLLPRNIAVQVFQALVESDASEHGSRMTAMDNAVRNAGDMIRKLTIKFNRTRQAAITTELMEIIGGAESLKG
ncbi:MAG: F0F1 ATP synthase subunit gamma [Magnetococcales bacterium]|nr:F0F1 ATP synthase subunit gamma [Magnetococcales bacterium]